MYISNATGCSSIWGGPAATSPYTVNKKGQGPAWCNSLFEDNAEHGLGMMVGQNAIRNNLVAKIKEMAAGEAPAEFKAAADAYLATLNNGSENGAATKALVAQLEEGAKAGCADCAAEYVVSGGAFAEFTNAVTSAAAVANDGKFDFAVKIV
jgi:pyruvate-ferredoxin/flavodoxin oxidoreductase